MYRSFAVLICLFFAAAHLGGCRTSARVEELDVASRTKIFWHPQANGLVLGLGVRDLGKTTAELILFVRNDGDSSVVIPRPGPRSVAFWVDSEPLPMAAEDAELGSPPAEKTIKLAPGARESYMVVHDFSRGQMHRVFAALGDPEDGRPLVTPEVKVSAVFGSPMGAYFSSWNEGP